MSRQGLVSHETSAAKGSLSLSISLRTAWMGSVRPPDRPPVSGSGWEAFYKYRKLTLKVQPRVGDGGGEADATLLLAAEGHAWRLLVQADAKALQLMLYQLLVRDGLQAVQHNQDEIACPCCTDDLHTHDHMSSMAQNSLKVALAESCSSLLAAEHAPGLLIQANAKTIQLVLYQGHVRDGLQAVQHNRLARPGRTENMQLQERVAFHIQKCCKQASLNSTSLCGCCSAARANHHQCTGTHRDLPCKPHCNFTYRPHKESSRACNTYTAELTGTKVSQSANTVHVLQATV